MGVLKHARYIDLNKYVSQFSTKKSNQNQNKTPVKPNVLYFSHNKCHASNITGAYQTITENVKELCLNL